MVKVGIYIRCSDCGGVSFRDVVIMRPSDKKGLRCVVCDSLNVKEIVVCRNCHEEEDAGNGLCPKCDVIRKDALEDKSLDSEGE